jgi:glycine/D-amino acid oxidase-like deaminating enzyme
MINGEVSFWQESLGPPAVRAGLPGPRDADVCVVGAGYTGLWTAWALAGAEPGLQIAVVEAEYAGFGASGRNGGWLSGLMPGSRERLARQSAGRPGGGRSLEPLRWLGVRSVYALYRAADQAEARRPGRHQTSRRARLADLVSGRP